MKITIIKQEQNNIEFLVERENGMYNNCNLSIELTEADIDGLSSDEIKTLAWLRVKPIAVRVFEQVEPLVEADNPIDFALVPPAPKRLELYGPTTLPIGNTVEYQATVYDQYKQAIAAELTWKNKTVTTTQTGEVVVTVRLGDLSKSLTVNVIARVKSKEEILQELIDTLITDNLNMQKQIDTLITSSLGV